MNLIMENPKKIHYVTNYFKSRKAEHKLQTIQHEKSFF